MTGTKTYVECVIPSYYFIKITATRPIYESTFAIEVSNNGLDFSTTNKTFKFIIINQVTGISPSTGPEEGGTLVNIFLKDLPFSGDPDLVTLAECYFPGYGA